MEEKKRAKKTSPSGKIMGRPTKYEPHFCQMLLDHMASGFSYESFAGVIGTHRDTLYNWEKEHSEFFDAKKLGSARNLLYWEKVGQQGLWGNKDNTFNATVWIFNMKNRHKWRDKQPEEVATVNISHNVEKMTDEELKKLIKDKWKKEELNESGALRDSKDLRKES